ncbi:MAG: hypothetical protein J0665_16420 [Deltaproteobacteria bacterium]|nr:hypothetical protein [Deltaproteobacteria bacterium]
MELTPGKKKVLIWYILIVSLMCVHPPWTKSKHAARLEIKENAGYDFVFDPPYGINTQIDFSRLFVQIIAASGVFGVLALRTKKEE